MERAWDKLYSGEHISRRRHRLKEESAQQEEAWEMDYRCNAHQVNVQRTWWRRGRRRRVTRWLPRATSAVSLLGWHIHPGFRGVGWGLTCNGIKWRRVHTIATMTAIIKVSFTNLESNQLSNQLPLPKWNAMASTLLLWRAFPLLFLRSGIFNSTCLL